MIYKLEERGKLKVLLCEPSQFGYSDYYYYVKHLSEQVVVDYYSLFENKEKVPYSGRYIVYHSRRRGIIGYIGHICSLLSCIQKSDTQVTIIRYFRYAFILRFLTTAVLVLDVRSVDVNSSLFMRLINNSLLALNCIVFNRVVTIDKRISDRLLTRTRPCVIPLGADRLYTHGPGFDSGLRVLYIGTLSNRRIHETVDGLSIFCENNPLVDIKYTIIGDGSKEDIRKIKRTIGRAPSNLVVKYLGYMQYEYLDDIFKENNVGISYVPLLDCFYPQPVTKTLEYLLAGMVVIGTALPFHYDVLTSRNGVITDDNPIALASALSKVYENREFYNRSLISKEAQIHSWEHVMKTYFVPTLKSIINDYGFVQGRNN